MRYVIKIGTSTLIGPEQSICGPALHTMAKGLKALMPGNHVVLVVSGAVGLGRSLPTRMPMSRAAQAATGQASLISAYQTALAPQRVAQLLVDNGHEPPRDLSAIVENLIANDIIPLVNGNDALHPNVGENDTLAAYLATQWGADQLILLSDINGVYTDNPAHSPIARRIPSVPWVTESHLVRFRDGCAGPLGSGGIVSKLRAAMIAQEAGIPTILMSGRDPRIWDWISQNHFPESTRFEAERKTPHVATGLG